MGDKTNILVPYRFRPREYERPLLVALETGVRRVVIIWHRRAGKDKTCLNATIREMFRRVGAYYYFFPTYEWGKKVIWDGMDKDGLPFLSHFPPETIADTNEQEMKVTLSNGSLFRVIGTDNIQKVRGTNPVGCVFSEYSHHNPRAWDVVRPILNENKGWAIFNYTPFGKNHGWEMSRMAQSNPDWFYQFLTIKDTRDEDDNPIITEEDIQKERDAGMPEELIQQEFYCSFMGSMTGAYYGQMMNRLREKGQVTSVQWEPSLPIDTWWDLGVSDSTAIWFTQRAKYSNEVRVIDCYSNSGEGLLHYIKHLQEKPYIYGRHYAPHDIAVRELSSGQSRLEVARSLGIRFEVVPKLSVEDRIDAVRRTLSRCWFDALNCKEGVDALENYHKEWDDKKRQYKTNPCHDWTSNYADAFRYMATGMKNNNYSEVDTRQRRAEGGFNVFDILVDDEVRAFNVFN